MTNAYYNVTGNPSTLSRGTSSLIRAEYAAIQAGFALLPLPAALFGNTANFLTDTGTASAMVVALTGNMATYITSLTDGLTLMVKAAAAATGASVITITGVASNVPIIRPQGSQLVANDYYAAQVVNLIYSASQAAFQYSAQGAASSGGSGLPTTGGSMTGALNEAKGANIASASTVNLTTATGNFVHITGTTTINAFTLAVGAERTVIFDGALTLANSASLLLPGAANITTQAGDRAIIRGDTAGANVISFIRAATILAFQPNYITGFTLSNDGVTPNSVLDIAAGFAADSTNTIAINGTAFTKSTAGVWAAGTGANGMGTGLTIANSTWYHVFAIINAGAFDVYFDTSTTAANKPASTTAFRYIGSFKTDGSAHIIAFTQFGQYFRWAVNVADLSGGVATSATAFTVSAPLGFVTFPEFNGHCFSSSVASTSTGTVIGGASSSGPADFVLTPAIAALPIDAPGRSVTNTSSQLYYICGANATLTVNTKGYINPHVAAVF